MTGTPITRIVVKLRRYWRDALEDPRWVLMFVTARLRLVRTVVLARAARSRPSSTHEGGVSVLDDLRVDDVVASLRRDGFCPGLKLNDDVVEEIRRFALTAVGSADRDAGVRLSLAAEEGEPPPSRPLMLEFDHPAERCPAIRRVRDDPALLRVAAEYLGASPGGTGTRLWWTFPGSPTAAQRIQFGQELFHYDPNDYGQVAFFFYLTDVDLASGPHVCVRGSHADKPLRHQLALLIGRSEDEIVEVYGRDRIETLCGAAGFGFAEDLFCFHRGTPPRSGGRLMLEVEFRLNHYRVQGDGLWLSPIVPPAERARA